jgi:acyl-CoA reductase-like NAD-dependent aldehyde dehydrogenase
VGDPTSADTDLGPLVSAAQLARVEGYVRDGVGSGARLLVGGGRPKDVPAGGYFFEPSIFAGVEPDMTIAQEEIFGPVLSVLTFADEDDAVARANDVGYGLAATVWTNRLDRALRLVDRLDAGIVWTNCVHHLVWNAPYEGHKRSGLGEDLGLEAIRTFTQLKVSYINISGARLDWGGNGK